MEGFGSGSDIYDGGQWLNSMLVNVQQVIKLGVEVLFVGGKPTTEAGIQLWNRMQNPNPN